MYRVYFGTMGDYMTLNHVELLEAITYMGMPLSIERLK